MVVGQAKRESVVSRKGHYAVHMQSGAVVVYGVEQDGSGNEEGLQSGTGRREDNASGEPDSASAVPATLPPPATRQLPARTIEGDLF